ncbi:GWxTD domain-containing protein [Granulicella aggregans]|uniref:GWxTD domain-containing protein n=1 Tax=Granulicella aggregans TaxID=474949 RepID=A0A7W7ZEI4_9BACT|nr:GWxTD domain-containing protein [Granulicella aggregans]
MPSLHAVSPKQLPPYFRQWIEEDVPYIITQEERREFLKLQSDGEREHFIELFWESRNPTPHSSINTFKEEHYRRLAYARANFGDDRYNDGWRTDMGRVYITLGPPQQKSNFHQGISTRPVEIWFYYANTPALPPTFNVVFYKPSEVEDYKLYSPRSDGPSKIVTNDPHDDAKALHTIDQSMGAEATHAMVSLIPSEPINIDHPDPSMESDILLSMIRSLPDQKLERQRIERQREASREVVTSRIFTGFNATELQTAVLRDSRGLSSVHYLVRKEQPDGGLIGVLPDKQTGYAMTLETHVLTEGGKAVYQRSDHLTGVTSAAGTAAGKAKLFAAEGRLPLVPGSYVIETILTNEISRESFRASQHVVVPVPQPDSLGVSGLIVYQGHALQTTRDQLPFTLAGLRFPPRGEQLIELHQGDKLPLVYQLWLPRPAQTASGPKPEAAPRLIKVHYTLGSIALSSGDPSRIEEDQDVSTADADAVGNLVSGYAVDTSNLREGTYRLVLRAIDPAFPRAAVASMTVRVVASTVPVDVWTAFGDEKLHPEWQDDMLRGIAAEALEHPEEATGYYRRVLAAKPDAPDAQSHLDALIKRSERKSPGE